MQFDYYLGSQLWRFDDNKLQNKKEIWMSDDETWKSTDEWSFKTYDNVTFVIENVSKKKVLEAANNGDVILKGFEYGKVEQLWEKRVLLKDAEGYFILETSRFCTWENGGCKNSSVPKILTATSKRKMKIKGKIILRRLNIHSWTGIKSPL